MPKPKSKKRARLPKLLGMKPHVVERFTGGAVEGQPHCMVWCGTRRSWDATVYLVKNWEFRVRIRMNGLQIIDRGSDDFIGGQTRTASAAVKKCERVLRALARPVVEKGRK